MSPPQVSQVSYNSLEQWPATRLPNISRLPENTGPTTQRFTAMLQQLFLSFSEEPGEVLPGRLVGPRYSFRETPLGIPGVGCQHAPVPLNCGASSPHQVVSELLWVKSEKQGPPAAPAWAWCSGEDYKGLCRANKSGHSARTLDKSAGTCPRAIYI